MLLAINVLVTAENNKNALFFLRGNFEVLDLAYTTSGKDPILTAMVTCEDLPAAELIAKIDSAADNLNLTIRTMLTGSDLPAADKSGYQVFCSSGDPIQKKDFLTPSKSRHLSITKMSHLPVAVNIINGKAMENWYTNHLELFLDITGIPAKMWKTFLPAVKETYKSF
jgi:hypothetical protein